MKVHSAVGWVAGAVALPVVLVILFFMAERRFYSKLHAIPIGTTAAEVTRLLGPPDSKGTAFRLGQLGGYEQQYREAAESRSVRYVFWRRAGMMVCAVGLDVQDRVAYKACGNT